MNVLRSGQLAILALWAAAAAAVTPASPAPVRAPGLWQLSLDGNTSAARQCVGAKDDVMKQRAFDAVRVKCEQAVWRQEAADRWVSDQTCTAPGQKSSHHAVFIGDSAHKVRVDMLTRMDPPQSGQPEERQSIQMERVGDCPAGVAPGSMVLPNGMVLDPAKAMAGKRPHP